MLRGNFNFRLLKKLAGALIALAILLQIGFWAAIIWIAVLILKHFGVM